MSAVCLSNTSRFTAFTESYGIREQSPFDAISSLNGVNGVGICCSRILIYKALEMGRDACELFASLREPEQPVAQPVGNARGECASYWSPGYRRFDRSRRVIPRTSLKKAQKRIIATENPPTKPRKYPIVPQERPKNWARRTPATTQLATASTIDSVI